MATLNNPTPAMNDWFGHYVAISGTRVVVGVFLDDTGASDAGSVYVYDLAGATPEEPVATLNNPKNRDGVHEGHFIVSWRQRHRRGLRQPRAFALGTIHPGDSAL